MLNFKYLLMLELIQAINYTPNGQYLLTGSDDK